MIPGHILLRLPADQEGEFVSRPNRFLGLVRLARTSHRPSCETAEMVLNARLATETPEGISSVRQPADRGGRWSPRAGGKQAVLYRRLQPTVGEKSWFEDSSGHSGQEEVHIHDPGRLRELLYPGNRVLLKRASGSRRKTRWDLLAARQDDHWILIHSGFHRALGEQILGDKRFSPFGHVQEFRAEVPVGKSRIDFLVRTSSDEEILLETKGCTLLIDGVALFPDAPTERGRRHLTELIETRHRGHRAAVLFLITQPAASRFAPHERTDPAFAQLFMEAVRVGVEIYPLVLSYDGTNIRFLRAIPYL